jgi:hypothetical protein
VRHNDFHRGDDDQLHRIKDVLVRHIVDEHLHISVEVDQHRNKADKVMHRNQLMVNIYHTCCHCYK